MKSGIKLFLLVTFIGILLLIAAVALGFVGVSYTTLVENQPLNDPVEVASFDWNTLVLKDGRTFSGVIYEKRLQEAFSRFGNQVEISEDGTIFASHPIFRCGFGSPRWTLPLIQYRADRYEKQHVGFVDPSPSTP